MKVDNIPNLVGKFKQISYGGNRIEVGDTIKFQNVLDDDQVYIDIKTKDTNLNLEQILELQNQINLQKTQLNLFNVQIGIERLLNKNQTKEIFLNKQRLKNLEELIAQNFKEHDSFDLSLPQWVFDFKNDYDNKIILFDGLYLDQVWMYSQFKRQLTKINVDIYDIYETLEDLKSVTNTTEGTSMAGVITAALALLGITGSTIGLSVWISGISTQVQVNTAGIAALQAQMGIVKAALDIDEVVGEVSEGVKKVTEKIQNMAEIVAEKVLTPWQKIQKLFKYGQQAYNIGSTIWQSINQSQTEEGMTKLERIEQTFEFDCEDGLMYDGYADVAPTNNGLKYMTINDHILLDKKYEFKCYDIHAQAGKIKNYDELFANHKQRLDTISKILGIITDQPTTPVVATSTVYEFYKAKTSGAQGSANDDVSYTDEYPQQEMNVKGKTYDLNGFYIQQLQNQQDQQDDTISTLKTNVDVNTLNIATLQNDLNVLQTNVATNTNDISTLRTDVNQNTSDIKTVKDNLTMNSNDIVTLKTNVNTNSTSINVLQTQTQTNTSNVSTLQTNVSTNTTDITNLKSQTQTNTTNITTLQTKVKQRMLGEIILRRKPAAWETSMPALNIFVDGNIHYYVLQSTQQALSNDSRYYDYQTFRGNQAVTWMTQPSTPPTGFVYLETIYIQ